MRTRSASRNVQQVHQSVPVQEQPHSGVDDLFQSMLVNQVVQFLYQGELKKVKVISIDKKYLQGVYEDGSFRKFCLDKVILQHIDVVQPQQPTFASDLMAAIPQMKLTSVVPDALLDSHLSDQHGFYVMTAVPLHNGILQLIADDLSIPDFAEQYEDVISPYRRRLIKEVWNAIYERIIRHFENQWKEDKIRVFLDCYRFCLQSQVE